MSLPPLGGPPAPPWTPALKPLEGPSWAFMPGAQSRPKAPPLEPVGPSGMVCISLGELREEELAPIAVAVPKNGTNGAHKPEGTR